MIAWVVRLALIGANGVKLTLHHRLAHSDTVLLSENLSGDCFDQIPAERQVTGFSRGRLMWIWEVLSGHRNEALDRSIFS